MFMMYVCIFTGQCYKCSEKVTGANEACQESTILPSCLTKVCFYISGQCYKCSERVTGANEACQESTIMPHKSMFLYLQASAISVQRG